MFWQVGTSATDDFMITTTTGNCLIMAYKICHQIFEKLTFKACDIIISLKYGFIPVEVSKGVFYNKKKIGYTCYVFV